MKWLINRWLEDQPKWRLVLISVLLCLSIGIVDYAIRIDLSVSVFYLMPITIAAWYINRSTTLLLAILCALAWLWADTGAKQYTVVLLPFWNSGIRLSFFILVGYLISLQKEAYQKEKALARIDDLTNVYNRRFFMEVLSLEIERSHRYQLSFTLAYMDIDSFKSVNDRLGHIEGDHLLVAVSQQLLQILRSTDVVGRLGGDEFAILIPQTKPALAHSLLSRIHENLTLTVTDRWPVGFSIGAVNFMTVPASDDQAIAQADSVMYEIKKSGKNRVGVRIFDEKALPKVSEKRYQY